MKRVLYISNIEVPYRIRFFNELAKKCDLTVLYEGQQSSNRDKAWSSGEVRRYKTEYLGGIRTDTENYFSLRIFKYITGKYDAIIVGCYNSPVQAMAVLMMRLWGITYYLNLDGEIHWNRSAIKNYLKRLILKGAEKYLVAGEKTADSLCAVAGKAPIIPYYFSSLTNDELIRNAKTSEMTLRKNIVLVLGQYFDYKGMDVALEAAKMDPSIPYLFAGMGKRTERFRQDFHTEDVHNVTIVPFLQKKDLEEEYRTCSMLVLPSRQECWGLVINEAASFGMPIVSTWGSGAAIEMIAEAYPQYLAKPSDAEELLKCIHMLRKDPDAAAYGLYLQEKNKMYSIEKSVQAHLEALEII